MSPRAAPVGIIMGSRSDWETMTHAARVLDALRVPYEARVVSAHRTPERMREYALSARDPGLCVVIAGAGGAAHLPGMVAAYTPVPVIGVPVRAGALQGFDALLSIAQMPAGIPVATMESGPEGARNAAFLAARIVALQDSALAARLAEERREAPDALEEVRS